MILRITWFVCLAIVACRIRNSRRRSFRKTRGVSPVGLRIRTYTYDGTWKGPTNSNWAKAAYGGRPAMYKIYLVADPVEPAESPCVDFVQEVFPTINDLLFPKESDSSAPAEEETSSSTDLEL